MLNRQTIPLKPYSFSDKPIFSSMHASELNGVYFVFCMYLQGVLPDKTHRCLQKTPLSYKQSVQAV